MTPASYISPKTSGYYFPAEWEKHRATWLSFPLNDESWPGKMNDVYHAFFQFIKIISLSENVAINVHNQNLAKYVLETAETYNIDLSRLEIYIHPTNDCWCRDHGPAFLKNSTNEKLILNWKFNGWGDKYPHDQDNQIPVRITDALKIPRIDVDLVMEGGSLDFNGQGSILTTKSCLINPNRNPGFSRHQIEKILINNYGADQILWLNEGIAGDDTDGHVDNITRFINNNSVITMIEEKKTDINYNVLKNNSERLSKFRLPNNNQLHIIEIPMPDPVMYKSERLPASYANFYITNDHVIVPTFQSEKDDKALEIIQNCFTGRKVIGIPSTVLVHGLGSFHCLSQQEPE